MKHAPPSERVIYRRSEDGHISVSYRWCEPDENHLLTAFLRGRGETFLFDATGRYVFHSSRGPRTCPPEDEP